MLNAIARTIAYIAISTFALLCDVDELDSFFFSRRQLKYFPTANVRPNEQSTATVKMKMNRIELRMSRIRWGISSLLTSTNRECHSADNRLNIFRAFTIVKSFFGVIIY